MFQAVSLGIDDTVGALKGHDGRDSKFCGLLNDPVHLVPFDQGLAEYDGWGLARRRGLLVGDAAVDGLWADMGHFHAIAGSASIVQGERVSLVQAEAVAKMMEQVTGYTDCGGSDGERIDEERGHRVVPG